MDNAKPGDLKVEKWNEEKDGSLTQSNMESKLRRQGYTFTRYDFPPGLDFPDHKHGVSKKDAILKGKMKFSMYGQTIILCPGDMIQVPKDTMHNAAVVGNDFLVFYDSIKDPNAKITEKELKT
jgi:quercetin dioxygenase-like cupin family protein